MEEKNDLFFFLFFSGSNGQPDGTASPHDAATHAAAATASPTAATAAVHAAGQ